mmetsp:Transcript_52298/g.64050  ORF Transcript_52298/g.64050 Transcript_52298/m.64050 type:complete len:554 (-) Transcript_52298:583-2244(-)
MHSLGFYRNFVNNTNIVRFCPLLIHTNVNLFCTNAISGDASALKKVRLKKKIDKASDNIGERVKKRASLFDVMKAHDKRVERDYKYISPRIGRVILGIYFLFAFGCLGYIYYNGLLPSRLMFIQPFMQNISPERAQQLGLKAVNWPRIVRRICGLVNNPMQYPIKLYDNLLFPNPIGLSAGYDRNGKGINGFLEMGFGFIEIGTVTPLPQNEYIDKGKRIIKLNKDHGLIHNCVGSDGMDIIRARLEIRMENMDRSVGMLGINIGYNITSQTYNDRINDYRLLFEKFIDLADYFTININEWYLNMSEHELTNTLTELVSIRDEIYKKDYDSSIMGECVECTIPAPGILLKIPLDITESQIYSIMNAINNANINGIIVSGSTKQRSNKLKTNKKYTQISGDLTGEPLFKRSNDLLKKVYSIRYNLDKMSDTDIKALNKQECFSKDFIIIGSGGVFSAKDAYKKIRSGATLVQLYSGLQYHGPIIMAKILRQLGQYAELDGFETVFHAIGADAREDKGLDKIGILPPDLEELMSELAPVPQKSWVAKMFGVITYD